MGNDISSPNDPGTAEPGSLTSTMRWRSREVANRWLWTVCGATTRAVSRLGVRVESTPGEAPERHHLRQSTVESRYLDRTGRSTSMH